MFSFLPDTALCAARLRSARQSHSKGEQQHSAISEETATGNPESWGKAPLTSITRFFQACKQPKPRKILQSFKQNTYYEIYI